MITILAPYNRTEATTAALRLAEYVTGTGTKVRYIVHGHREVCVDPRWDGVVQSWRANDNLVKAAAASTTVVHFGVSPKLYAEATLADSGKKTIKQVLVPLWHSFNRTDRNDLKKYDQIVCPSKAMKKMIETDLYDGVRQGKDSLTWVRWDAGRPHGKREGTVNDGRTRALFYCDSQAVDFSGPMVLELADNLLKVCDRLDITLLHSKSWSKRDKQGLRRLQMAWPSARFNPVRNSSLRQYNLLLAHNDWTVIPGVRSDFGIAAAMALAGGTPVICHDVHPFCDTVRHHENGLLVPCEIRTGWFRSPVAIPSLGTWVDTCTSALLGNERLFAMQTHDWKVDEAYDAFANTWDRVLVA